MIDNYFNYSVIGYGRLYSDNFKERLVIINRKDISINYFVISYGRFYSDNKIEKKKIRVSILIGKELSCQERICRIKTDLTRNGPK